MNSNWGVAFRPRTEKRNSASKLSCFCVRQYAPPPHPSSVRLYECIPSPPTNWTASRWHVTRRPSGSTKTCFILLTLPFLIISFVLPLLFRSTLCLFIASFLLWREWEIHKITFPPDWITVNTSLCQRSADSRSPRSQRGHDVVSFPECLSYDVRHSQRLEEREEDIILFEVSLAYVYGQMFQTCERREY